MHAMAMRKRPNMRGYLYRWDKDVSTDHKKISLAEPDQPGRKN